MSTTAAADAAHDAPQQQLHEATTDYVNALARAVSATMETMTGALQEVAADLVPSVLDAEGSMQDQPPAPAGEDEAGASPDEFDWEQLDIGQLDITPIGKLQLQAIKQKMLTPFISPKRVLLRDKLAFMIGSCQVWAMAYWLGWSPQTFYLFYTGQTLVLMAIRFAMYRHKKIHYYMLDFCYFANLLSLLHIWVLPRNALLAKVTFAFNSGPLIWSIAAFRNSLVFHDLDRVTSVFIHLVPSAVTWTLRWHVDISRFGPGPNAGEEEVRRWQHASFLELVVLPMLPYLTWSMAYYLKIFVFSAQKIKARGYVTLFTWVTTTKRGVYASITKRVPEQYRPQVYLFLHWCFCVTTFSLSWVCWHHFWLHTVLVVAMGLTSLWNGANFYFTVFAKRYLKELEQKSDGHQYPSQLAQGSGSTSANGSEGKKHA